MGLAASAQAEVSFVDVSYTKADISSIEASPSSAQTDAISDQAGPSFAKVGPSSTHTKWMLLLLLTHELDILSQWLHLPTQRLHVPRLFQTGATSAKALVSSVYEQASPTNSRLLPPKHEWIYPFRPASVRAASVPKNISSAQVMVYFPKQEMSYTQAGALLVVVKVALSTQVVATPAQAQASTRNQIVPLKQWHHPVKAS